MPAVTADEYIEFQHASYTSLILGTPAMVCTDWSDLYGDPPLEGSDVRLLGQDGLSARDRTTGPLRGLLHVTVKGTRDADGIAYAHRDIARGLTANLQQLKQVTGIKTTQTIILHRRDGTSPSAVCQVLGGLRPRWEWPLIRCTLDVQLPDGALL